MHPPFRLRITRAQATMLMERDIGALPATLGRGSRSTVILNDPTMSKEHAMLLIENGSLVVRDLGSRNGVLVRERTQRVESARLSEVGFAFSIGSFDICVVPMATRGQTMLLGRGDPRTTLSAGPEADLANCPARYREACADLYVVLTERLVILEPDRRAAWLRAFGADNPDAACQPMFRDMLSSAAEDEVERTVVAV